MVFDEGGVLAIHVGVKLWAHLPTAAPRFVSDCEERDFPRLVAPVLAAHVGERGVGVGSHVFDPVHLLLWRATADVAVNVSVSTEQFAKLHELVRAESVRVNAAPACIGTARTFVAWSNAVAPVILVGE